MNQQHNLPPVDDISMHSDDSITFTVETACHLCCDIGNRFTPDMTDVELEAGTHTFTAKANSSGSGFYNTSARGTTCHPQGPALTGHSIQVTTP